MQVEDHFEQYGTAYLVMEFVEGGALYDHLLEKGSLDVKSIIQLTTPLLEALNTVHAQDLLHRDLNPNNIILRDGSITQPVLIDFGAARHANGIRSASIAQVVNDGYSPPEQYQAREEQTPALDVYAVGSTLYRCLTGERPQMSLDRYNRDAVASSMDRFKDGSANLLVPIITKAMNLDKTKRHQSAADLKAEIAKVASVIDVLDGLDGEAGSTDQADGLYWSVRSDGSIELTGMLQSLAQFDQLQSQLANAAPERQLINRAELKTTPAPKEIRAVPASEAATKLVDKAAIASDASEKLVSGASNGNGSGASNATSTAPQEAENHTASPPPQRRFSGLAKTAAVFIGGATLAGGIYLFAGQGLTQSPGPSTPPTVPTPSEPKRQAENPFGVTIELPRDTYNVGDAITFKVTATKDCNFTVHTVDADGTHKEHDPKKLEVFMGPQLLRAGEARSIPVEGAPGRAIVEEPKGPYQIFAVCGRKDLEQIGIVNERLRKARKVTKRNFNFVFDEELKGIDKELLARASVSYTVK